MKRTFTKPTVIPDGYTGKNFNNWSKKIYKQLDKTVYTKISSPNLYQRIINSL